MEVQQDAHKESAPVVSSTHDQNIVNSQVVHSQASINNVYRVKPKYSPIGVFTPLLNTDVNITKPSINKSSPTVLGSSAIHDHHNSSLIPRIKDAYSVQFNNNDLCFFKGNISCPSVRDLRRLISRANKTGELLHAKGILLALQSDQSDDDEFPLSLLPKSDSTFDDPYTVPTIAPIVSLIHPDSGASVSIIRKSIAEQLNTPIFKLSNPLLILDINQGVKSHDEVCYIQIEIPEVSSFRAVVLCIVKKESHIPFLLSMADQAAYRITPQADTREITLGGEGRHHIQGKVKFLCYDEWFQNINRPLRHVSSTQLALQNRSLLRQTNKSKVYSTSSPRIEILSHSGMFQQRVRQPSTDKTKITSEEIRQAIQHAPPPQGPRAAAVQTLDHQVQLLVTEPKISKEVDKRKKYDEWRSSNEVQQLLIAKLDSSVTDDDISHFTRIALQSGLKTFSNTTPSISSTIIAEQDDNIALINDQLASLCEYMECYNELRDNTMSNGIQEEPIETIDSSSIHIHPTNLALNALNAYLVSTSPILNSDPETPIYEIYSQESLDALYSQVIPEEEGVLTPNKYDREYIPVYATQFKPSKVPSKPVKEVKQEEVREKKNIIMLLMR